MDENDAVREVFDKVFDGGLSDVDLAIEPSDRQF